MIAAPPRRIARLLRSNQVTLRQPKGLAEILAWLATEASPDAALDLAPFQRHCVALSEATLDAPHYHRILDLFYDRAHDYSEALRPRLSEAKLPLERELRAIATALIAIHGQVASGYERVLRDAGGRLAGNKWRNPSVVAARALRCLSEQFEISCMVSAATPPDLWHRAHTLARASRDYYEPEITVVPGVSIDAEKIYKAMLALAATQPEGFSPQEVALTCAYLTQFSAAVEILREAPVEGTGWYWIDLTRDNGPTPQGRHIPPVHGEILYCSFRRLARLIGEQLSALNTGMPAGNLRLPQHADGHSGRCALKRMEAHWTEPPQRKLSRRHNNDRVQICIGLTELWKMLDQGEAPAALKGAQPYETQTTEWMIVNESPTGYGVMHVAGEIDGLAPGSAVALRTGAHQPWSICVVRWMKSDNPEHVELGLEILAPAALSVRLVFRNGDPSQLPTAGLLLPPIPALREHAALLAPSGSYSAKRFFIVSGDDTTQVTQGRLLSLDMQTGSLELFQFEPDPYPL